MRKVLYIFLLIAIGCSKDYMSLAKVNGDSISIADFKDRLREIQFDPRLVAEEDLLALKKTILNELIEEKLIEQESRKLNINVTKEEVDQAMQVEHLDAVLEKQKVDKNAWAKKMKQKVLAEKLFNSITQKVVEPTEEEIKVIFDTNQQLFQQQEQINLQQIAFRDKRQAEEARNDISSGQTFESIAQKYSAAIDPNPSQDLGFIPKGILPENIEKKVFSLNVNGVSPVLEADGAFYIFKVLARKEDRPLLWEEARQQIQTMLLQKAKDKHYTQWLQEKTLKADIKRNYELLQENFHI